ncbi:ATP-binding cassette domain-containing protein [Streptomyces sp. NPDC048045]|uniref:ABC transporter ATP-binding protein n=1 Tax=Streptomyces sp. NPDC048045 TaxID=3154710 RepID=UPI00341BBFEB
MTPVDLRVVDLSVRHPGPRGPVTAVDRVGIRLPAGRVTALVGESGSGKSTLARALVGLVRPHTGRVLVDGRALRVRTVRDRRWVAGRVQMVFQDPDTALDPRMTVRDTLVEAASALVRLERPDRDARVAELLGLVGLDAHIASRLPRELSGGQRQRVALARALAVGPGALIADEITSALDAPSQAAVLGTLRDLQRRLGLNVLFISHSLTAVRQVADHVAVMRLGRIVEHACAEDLFRSPGHPYTRTLLDAEPTLLGDAGEPSPAVPPPVPPPIPQPIPQPGPSPIPSPIPEAGPSPGPSPGRPGT